MTQNASEHGHEYQAMESLQIKDIFTNSCLLSNKKTKGVSDPEAKHFAVSYVPQTAISITLAIMPNQPGSVLL